MFWEMRKDSLSTRTTQSFIRILGLSSPSLRRKPHSYHSSMLGERNEFRHSKKRKKILGLSVSWNHWLVFSITIFLLSFYHQVSRSLKLCCEPAFWTSHEFWAKPRLEEAWPLAVPAYLSIFHRKVTYTSKIFFTGNFPQLLYWQNHYAE